LATQANFFAGAGINASLGSAAQLQNNAFGNAHSSPIDHAVTAD